MNLRLFYTYTICLLLGVLPAAGQVADKCYIEPFNIEAGQTKDIKVLLNNSTEYIGFQVQLSLPSDLEFVKAELSDRADPSHSLMLNQPNATTVKLICFSTTNASFKGSDGALLTITLKARETFSGGEFKLDQIIFADKKNQDVDFAPSLFQVGTQEQNNSYIASFKIDAGKTKEISLMLDNETNFTAFQTEIVLPEGLSLVEGSLRPTNRIATHTLSSRTFEGGVTRLVCFSTANALIAPGKGPILTFTVKASPVAVGTKDIKLQKQLFSLPNAVERELNDSSAEVEIVFIPVESITTASASEQVMTGERVQLNATVSPQNASDKSLTWKSEDNSIATVSQSGLVTGVNPGEVTITAYATSNPAIQAKCSVKVLPILAENITLNASQLNLRIGDTSTIQASISPKKTTNKKVAYKSSNPNVASVDENGVVTALSRGSAEITATTTDGSNLSASCSVSVTYALATKVQVDQNTLQMRVQDKAKLTATVTPETALGDVVWSSSKEQVATVDSQGNVTALSVGFAKITATATDGSNQFAECLVTVDPALVASLTISASSLALQVGDATTLQATLLPEYAGNRTVKWSSSREDVATVSQAGVISANSVGTATITATTTDGSNLTKSCEVTVVIPKYKITYNVDGENGTLTSSIPSGTSVEKGTEVTFTATPAEGYEVYQWTINGQAPETTTETTKTISITKETNVSVSFKKKEFTVTFTAGENGQIIAKNGETVISSSDPIAFGTKLTFTATPAEGYEVYQWTINGQAPETTTETTKTISITKETNVSVSFKKKEFTVTFTAGENGLIIAKNGETVISSGDPIAFGTKLTFTATPAEGYEVYQWTVNGQAPETTTETTKTISITKETNVSVSFKKKEFTVTFTAGENGQIVAKNGETIISSGDPIAFGTELTFTAIPAEGYRVKSWTIDDLESSNTAVTQSIVVKKETTVFVSFEKIPVTMYKITYLYGDGGTLTAKLVNGSEVASGSELEAGSVILFTATPNKDYKVAKWLVNDTQVSNKKDQMEVTISEPTKVEVYFESTIRVDVVSDMERVQVYPNPVSTELTVSGLIPKQEVRLASLAGQIVKITRANVRGDAYLDVTMLPKGDYLIIIDNGNSYKVMIR